jgi:hypothetical protein
VRVRLHESVGQRRVGGEGLPASPLLLVMRQCRLAPSGPLNPRGTLIPRQQPVDLGASDLAECRQLMVKVKVKVKVTAQLGVDLQPGRLYDLDVS